MQTNKFWIPTTMSLPRQHSRVLVVCFNPANHMDRHISIAEYWGQDKQTGRHIWSGNKHVSYWADLPEIPEETPSEKKYREDITLKTLREMSEKHHK